MNILTTDWLKKIELQGGVTDKNDLLVKLNYCNGMIYKDIPGDGIEQKANYLLENELVLIKQPVEEIKDVVKRKINLLVADNTEPRDYIDFLSEIFEVNLLKIKDFNKEFTKKNVDLVLFTGGEDVNPEYYEDLVGANTYINKNRDEKERDIFNKFKGCRMFGVCRGAQFLTVMNKGKLIQDVSGHGRSHEITIRNDGTYTITSTHHQMMWPYNLPKQSYDLLGYSTYFQSNKYLNGENNQMELPSDFLEAEIVYYPYNTCLCIQGHPEYDTCDLGTRKMCQNLIKKYLFSDKKESLKPYDPFSNEENDNGDYGFEIQEEVAAPWPEFELPSFNSTTAKQVQDLGRVLYGTGDVEEVKKAPRRSFFGNGKTIVSESSPNYDEILATLQMKNWPKPKTIPTSDSTQQLGLGVIEQIIQESKMEMLEPESGIDIDLDLDYHEEENLEESSDEKSVEW